MNDIEYRKCETCGDSKPLGEFYAQRKVCKVCYRGRVKEYEQQNVERIRRTKALYRATNQEKIRAYNARNNRRKDRSKYGNPKSWRAVRAATKRGELPSLGELYCYRCHGVATDYHHQSYLDADVLCVVPVCHSCHNTLNRWRPIEGSDLGVVVTRYGLVRIAISEIDNT